MAILLPADTEPNPIPNLAEKEVLKDDTYGDISNIVLNNSYGILGAFYKVASDITITTISGITATYRAYVAVADNSYPGLNTLTIT